jgi:hypothetical protein
VRTGGLGGLEPPTSPLSVLRPLLPEYHSSLYRMRSRLDNSELMLWRVLQQHRDEALQKSNTPKDHNSRMGFEGMVEHSRNRANAHTPGCRHFPFGKLRHREG